jgi:transposase InsO family protein
MDESDRARNMTDVVDGFLAGKRYLIHDRDPLFTKEFLSILAAFGIESVKLPPRSPNLNACAERFVRSIKEGCLEQMILFVVTVIRLARPGGLRAVVAESALITSLTRIQRVDGSVELTTFNVVATHASCGLHL